jgi:hypothetical protein
VASLDVIAEIHKAAKIIGEVNEDKCPSRKYDDQLGKGMIKINLFNVHHNFDYQV